MFVYEMLRKTHPVKGMFGIEIEVEGRRLPEVVYGNWEVDMNEGSLRDGGLEYITRTPSNLPAIMEDVAALKKQFLDNSSSPNFSPRTSVHAHVNVTDLTFNQLCNFIFISFLLEGNLSHFCGKVRRGNQFCIPGKNAEGVFDIVENIFTNKSFSEFSVPRNYRYSFINLTSLNKYGSLEFRGMRGTLDKRVIKSWLETLQRFKNTAREYTSPVELISDIKRKGLKKFCNSLITKGYQFPSQHIDRREAFNILRTLVVLTEDWDEPLTRTVNTHPDNPFLRG
ncbi:MAG: hypothetical protein Unbinned6805contig1000_21 [Prokaryotic dsDNA virus sp.]|nr:MAG: hypothetical protein Unbinned6805contig1000_21 [Prokaryotic dsDNA virus sp.]|tara:strand:- start:27052 stop:27897 length:846 start_codon:yes stop_codon:yes gene_type:complete